MGNKSSSQVQQSVAATPAAAFASSHSHNASGADCSPPPNRGEYQFDMIKRPDQIDSQSAQVLVIHGVPIHNKKVPFKFASVLAGGRSSSGKALYHAGVYLEGDFYFKGQNFKYVLVEWWVSGIKVTFYGDKAGIWGRFHSISVYGTSLTDVTETPLFPSSIWANHIVDFMRAELQKPFEMTEDMTKESVTNCSLFALRAGAAAAESKQHWATACHSLQCNLNI